MATSAVDLIIPVGLLLWIVITQLAIFFVFLWKGGSAIRGLSLSSGLGLVMSILSLVIGVTPEPILWVYDNQTTVFSSVYLVPQAKTAATADIYYGLVVMEAFLVITACMK